jgi:hypothetical protein
MLSTVISWCFQTFEQHCNINEGGFQALLVNRLQASTEDVRRHWACCLSTYISKTSQYAFLCNWTIYVYTEKDYYWYQKSATKSTPVLCECWWSNWHIYEKSTGYITISPFKDILIKENLVYSLMCDNCRWADDNR